MRALAFCSILAVAVACASGNEAEESDAGRVPDLAGQRDDSSALRAGADSVAANADSANPRDAAVSDTAPRPATGTKPRPATGTTAKDVSVSSTSAAVVGDSVVRRDSIIGRDSAFGPRYRIDSTGKLVPIRRP